MTSDNTVITTEMCLGNCENIYGGALSKHLWWCLGNIYGGAFL